MQYIAIFSKWHIIVVSICGVAAVAAVLLVTTPAVAPGVTEVFGPTIPFEFAGVAMSASIADTPEERRLGLSGTTSLPPQVAKVFVFDASDRWSFWMKDMQYPIDIFWIASDGRVVHIEPNVAPETYPTTFTPPEPAQFVIETVAGFAYDYNVSVGATIDVSPFIAKP
jgi:hypothetical protein